MEAFLFLACGVDIGKELHTKEKQQKELLLNVKQRQKKQLIKELAQNVLLLNAVLQKKQLLKEAV
jgi:hypothetical protein